MSTRLRLFPLSAVLFPGAALNLHVFEPRYKQMIGECIDRGEGFGVVLINEGDETDDPLVEPYRIGSVAEIVDVTPLPFGRFYISTIGRQRFRITRIVSREPFLTVEAELLEEDVPEDAELEELSQQVRLLFAEYLGLIVEFSGEQSPINLPADPESTSFAVGDALQVADTMKQRILEIDSTQQRLTVELGFLRRLLPQLRKMLERRKVELQVRSEPGGEDEQRGAHEKFFGKYFSLN
ncbi:MAG: LON peptidase substrate-binding domain-containing protein [Candidatus Eremiobacteraeota bacterium]|nr:LON peptidase substrate-binding domain-containing protein [Candidatus Eremiobacteraeota bacterium]